MDLNKKFAGSVVARKVPVWKIPNIKNGIRNTRRAAQRILMEVVGI